MTQGKKIPPIIVPKWMETEQPMKAQFCKLVNFALEGAPDMSLAEFASLLCEANKEDTFDRLGLKIKEQLREVGA